MQLDYTLQEIDAIAKSLLAETMGQKCFAFFAPMGAGKTTLIKSICKALEVEDNVSSPTYSIINEYRTKSGDRVVHMDWYRLKDELDALNAGIEDYIIGAGYCLIEWPERAEGLLPKDCARLQIDILDRDKRRISIIQS